MQVSHDRCLAILRAAVAYLSIMNPAPYRTPISSIARASDGELVLEALSIASILQSIQCRSSLRLVSGYSFLSQPTMIFLRNS